MSSTYKSSLQKSLWRDHIIANYNSMFSHLVIFWASLQHYHARLAFVGWLDHMSLKDFLLTHVPKMFEKERSGISRNSPAMLMLTISDDILIGYVIMRTLKSGDELYPSKPYD